MTAPEVTDQDVKETLAEDAAVLDSLQSKIDELGKRIRTAVPEGYDLHALMSEYRLEVAEDVFEITADHEALVRLTGPVAVPGATPPPAFETSIATHFDLEGREMPEASGGRSWILKLAFALIVLAAIATVTLFLAF